MPKQRKTSPEIKIDEISSPQISQYDIRLPEGVDKIQSVEIDLGKVPESNLKKRGPMSFGHDSERGFNFG